MSDAWEAAVEAGARSLFPAIWDERLDRLEYERPELDNQRTTCREDARAILTAALPHLRRHITQELAEKAEDDAERAQKKWGRTRAGAPECDAMPGE